MSKFKGILKRTSGGLKKAASVAPLVVAIGGFLLMVPSSISAIVFSVQKGNYMDEVKATDNYVSAYVEDNKKNEEDYLNKNITPAEYKARREYFDSEEYFASVVADDKEISDKYNALLKSQYTSCYCLASGEGLFFLGLLGTYVWDKTGLDNNLNLSAARDLYEANCIFKEEKKKKLQEKGLPFEEEEVRGGDIEW